MQIQNVRFIIAVITTFSAFSVYVSRVNLSIAIIAMVEDHHGEHNNSKAAAATGSVAALNSSRLLIAPFNSSDNHPPLLGHENNTAAAAISSSASSLTNSPTDGVSQSSSSSSVIVVESGATNETNGQQVQQVREPLLTNFPTSKKSLQLPLIWQEKFAWNQIEQGHILGAFFYGYILIQIPGARLAESVGAKWIIMAASAGSAVISLTFPLSTQLNSIYLLMALRFVMGLCQSAFFPAAYVLFCRWLPERERSVLLPIMFIGGNMGSISTYIMSSYLISSSYGWPSVFYVSGGICSICSVLWMIFGSSAPSDNWLISKEERRFIEMSVENQASESNSLNGGICEGDEVDQKQQQHNCCLKDCANETMMNTLDQEKRRLSSLEQKLLVGVGAQQSVTGRTGKGTGEEDSSLVRSGQQEKQVATTDEANTCVNGSCKSKNNTKKLPPTPSWSKLITSIPVWTLILSMYGNEWSHVVICYELPTYLNTALNFPIEHNGVINSFLQLSYSLASPIMSSLGAYLLASHWLGMRKIHVRKLFQSLATFGQLFCFVSVPICGANRGLIIMFMFMAIIFKSCANAGDIMVAGDLSPEYAGTIFASANSFGNTAGFFVPILTGVFVTDPYIREQWTPFWFTTACIMCFSGLIFITFGETRRQDFSLDGLSLDVELELEANHNELMAKKKKKNNNAHVQVEKQQNSDSAAGITAQSNNSSSKNHKPN